MDVTKLPTDSLYKFLTILGISIAVLAVVLPTGAYWQLQLKKNAAEGEVREHEIRKTALIGEITRLEADGVSYWKRSLAKFDELGQIAETVRTEIVNSPQAAGDIDNDEMEALQSNIQQVATVMKEIQKLETSPQMDESAIHEQERRLQNMFTQMIKGVPDDVTIALKTLLKALQTQRELNRLESVAKPNEEVITKKKEEAHAAEKELEAKIDSVITIRLDRQNQTKAKLLGRMAQGISQVIVAHFESLRLADLSRESGAQLHGKTTDLKITELELETKTNAVAIVGRQTTYAVWLGVAGVALGACIAAFGLRWWYRIEKIASAIAAENLARATRDNAITQASKIIVEP